MWLNTHLDRKVADFKLEMDLHDKGYRAVAGLDEAGRGSLFGPVVAAAVVFPEKYIRTGFPAWVSDITDSKLIAPRKRERLAKAILSGARSVGVGIATNREIDQKNIHWASMEAMRRAVVQLSVCPDFLLVDGFQLDDVSIHQMGLRHGDRRSISVAAASILAKVLRDRMMINLDKVYEGYQLPQHKGYGTQGHFQVLEEKGPTIFHRFSFRPLNRDKI